MLFIVRFSHGEVVYVSELREFLECDLSNLEEGSSCLARHEDGIWYPAKITGIHMRVYFMADQNFIILLCTVFSSYNLASESMLTSAGLCKYKTVFFLCQITSIHSQELCFFFSIMTCQQRCYYLVSLYGSLHQPVPHCRHFNLVLHAR